MAYVALYRKWRPSLFEDVVGQRHITETLQKAIETDKVAHAYLFSGPRGTGKTSTAKIFAKALNCIHGPTPHPCNECEVCRHIASGESMDVAEIDAASNRSIEDIRTLRETIKFMPAEGHKKIYIIDEVHMLTTEAFNALLKTLEEPPSHVVFILATTEPEKIPMTILSRCQRYEFRRITSEDIAGRLLYVAQQEKIDLTGGAAHILAVQADGGMRDALSMLDQCVSNASGTIDETLVRELLGLIGRDWIFKLSGAVFEGRGDVIIQAVDEIVHMGKEPRVILMELVAHLRALMLYQAAPQSDTLAAYADSQAVLAAQAGQVPAGRVFAVLNVLQQALLSVRTSPTPRVTVEMGLLLASHTLRLSQEAAGAGTAIPEQESVLERITRLEQQVAQLQNRPAVVGEVSRRFFEEMPLPSPEEQTGNTVPGLHNEGNEQPAVSTDAALPQVPEGPAVIPAKKAVAVSAPPPAQYARVWNAVQQDLDHRKKRVVASCMGNGAVIAIDGCEVVVTFKTEFMLKRATKEDYCQCVNEALETVLGSGYHMRAFLENDPELSAYQKKKLKPAAVEASLEQPELENPLDKEPSAADSLQPIAFAEIPQSEQDAIKPLLETLGECTIYIENKNT